LSDGCGEFLCEEFLYISTNGNVVRIGVVVRIDDGAGCTEERVTPPREVGVMAKTVDVILPPSDLYFVAPDAAGAYRKAISVWHLWWWEGEVSNCHLVGAL